MNVEHQRVLVYRAGNIPYVVENEQIYMMFMVPSNQEFGGSDPQLAKGKVEEGETHKECSIRESKEELGLFVGNIIFTEEVGVFMGRTTVFVSKIKNKDMFGLPTDETASTHWLTPEQFEHEGRILHRPVIAAAVRLIKKLEGMN